MRARPERLLRLSPIEGTVRAKILFRFETGDHVHNELRKLLRTASGDSQFVLAVNIDIRGFSAFFKDSSQAAAYLSSAYTKILDEYYPEASFFKPTGDGILLVQIINRENLQSVVSTALTTALKLDKDFATICAEDPLINFETPIHVGIGLSRGSATRLSANKKTLDYSGKPLNLASRLMDLARPHGVVVDASTFSGLPSTTLPKDMFTEDIAYIKGIADFTPMDIFTTKSVKIPLANKKPIGGQTVVEDAETITFAELRRRAPSFIHALSRPVLDPDSVRLRIEHPFATRAGGSKVTNMVKSNTLKPAVVRDLTDGIHMEAVFNYDTIAKVIEKNHVKSTWQVQLQVSYTSPLAD